MMFLHSLYRKELADKKEKYISNQKVAAQQYIAKLDNIKIKTTIKLNAYMLVPYKRKNIFKYIGFYLLPFDDSLYNGYIVTNLYEYLLMNSTLLKYCLVNKNRKIVAQGKTYYNSLAPEITDKEVYQIAKRFIK